MIKRLVIIALLLNVFGSIISKAEKTAYAYYSNNKLTFRYGEIPENSVQTWDVSDTGENIPEWSSNSKIRNDIFTVVFHESFAEARPKSCYAWFSDCVFLKGFVGMEYLNTSEVSNMSRMFAFCSNLSTLDISMFETGSLTNIKEMFINCKNLKSINFGNNNFAQVTSLENLFYGCTWLKEVDLTRFNTSNVTSMYCMFWGCENIETIDLSSFNTQNIAGIGMSAMFSGCKKLTTIYVGDEWSNERTMYLSNNTFYNCFRLVGGNGTRYSEPHQSAYYARVDTNETPGYMTYKKSSSGIATQYQTENYEIKRYNLSGQLIKKGSTGVNIIRMNDGNTRKVIIR